MKRKWMRFFKGLGIFLAIAVAVVGVLYTAAWFSLTKRTQVYIDAVWTNPAFTIEGKKPELTGFPLEPRATFSGTFAHSSGFKIVTPALSYAGFSAPNQLQYLEAPEGLFLSAPFLDQDIQIDYGMIQVRVPRYFPTSPHKAAIEIWQKSDTPFVIPHMVLRRGPLSAVASGTISLDENLQLKGDMDARIIGMDSLLDSIAKGHGEKTVTMAKGFLNMLTETDPVTGESYFQTKIRIQDNGVFIGPMRVASLPRLTWTP